MKNILYIFYFFGCFVLHSQDISGTVYAVNADGTKTPLEGVNVYWQDTTQGTITDLEGKFSLPRFPQTDVLVFRYLGFITQIRRILSSETIEVLLEEDLGENLEEVTLTQRRKTLQKSYLEAQNIVKVNSKELLKAACCNLSESFETNPSIDVNFSDALTGTKQIKMLGLSSPYLLISEENIPSVRGASQIFGLTFTPGTWIESIQITKGAGSVTNGFESIAGQINTELKKPLFDFPLYVNLYSSANGRQEANVHGNMILSDKWSTGFYLHGNQRNQKFDQNKDGFIDIPLAEQINLFHRWQYTDAEKGWVGFLGLRYLKDEKQTGETDFNPSLHKNSLLEWGSEIDTERIDASFKMGHVFPATPYNSFGLQTTYNQHRQDAYYGLRNYQIHHDSFFGNLLFNSIFGSTQRKFKVGVNFAWDQYQEWVDSLQYRRTDRVVGGFFEYTYDSLDKLNFTAGVRLDYHNNLGTFVTPRFHLRYNPGERSVFRLSVGQGRKAANIFAENQTVFGSGRTLEVLDNGGSIYGLRPEKAWNYGSSFTQAFTFFGQLGDVTVDYYVTRFEDQVVVDWENPQYLRFYNLEGKSFAQSLQLEFNYVPFRNTALRVAYKNYIVKTTYGEELLQRPLQPQHRFFANFEYIKTEEVKEKEWRYDLTLHALGKQRLPNNIRDGNDAYSPAYALLNSQITRVFTPAFEVYLGVENLTNYRLNRPIISADQPFGRNFDTTLIYAPVFGRMIYMGLRYKLNKKG